MEKIILIGGGGHCKACIDVIEQAGIFDIARILEHKRQTALMYYDFVQNLGVSFISEPESAASNYWLNTIILKDKREREHFLAYSREKGIQTRPVWRLMPPSHVSPLSVYTP